MFQITLLVIFAIAAVGFLVYAASSEQGASPVDMAPEDATADVLAEDKGYSSAA